MLRSVAVQLLVALVATSSLVQSARILTVFPAVSKSHFAVGEALSVGLARAGHEVTMISPYDYQSPHPNLRNVFLDGAIEVARERTAQLKSVESFNMPIPAIFALIFWDAKKFSAYTLTHAKVQPLLQNGSFDLVITEIFANEALIGLGQHFNAPIIGVSTFGASKWTTDLVGSPSPLSYVPHAFSTFSQRMSLTQRVLNSLLSICELVFIHALNYPAQREAYAEAFPNARLSYDEAQQNVSLVLLNSHFSINAPRPYLPNMIEVGGMHVKREVNPLPAKLQAFLDSATDGVIYFSLGSFVQSSYMSPEHKAIFVRVFNSLKQRVVWKFETELEGLAENVLIDKWLPQNDILAHKNVRLFITHGGLLSTTESVFHGKPVIGMPLFGDQMRNIQGAVLSGWGVQLDYTNVTEASLRWALATALDESFGVAARSVSQRYRDQPMTPLETAVYWSEYVIRHKGAAHIRSAAMDLNFVEYHSLDVFAILLAFSLLSIAVFYLLVRWAIRRCRQRSAAKKGAAAKSGGKQQKKKQ